MNKTNSHEHFGANRIIRHFILLSLIIILFLGLSMTKSFAEDTYEARIGNKYYKTLEKAILSVADNETIVLLTDMTTYNCWLTPRAENSYGDYKEYNYTLDLNNHEVTQPYEPAGYAVFRATAGKVTIKNGMITTPGSKSGLTADGVGVWQLGDSSVYLEDILFRGAVLAILGGDKAPGLGDASIRPGNLVSMKDMTVHCSTAPVFSFGGRVEFGNGVYMISKPLADKQMVNDQITGRETIVDIKGTNSAQFEKKLAGWTNYGIPVPIFSYALESWVITSAATGKVAKGPVKYYDTLEAAFANESTVHLLRDISTDKTITVPSSVEEFHLGGYTIRYSGTENAITVSPYSDLKLASGNIDAVNGSCISMSSGQGKLSLQVIDLSSSTTKAAVSLSGQDLALMGRVNISGGNAVQMSGDATLTLGSICTLTGASGNAISASGNTTVTTNDTDTFYDVQNPLSAKTINTIRNPLCTIEGTQTGFSSLNAAFRAVDNNQTLLLTRDVNGTDVRDLMTISSKKFTLDMMGYTINQDFMDKSSPVTLTVASGDVTIKNGTFAYSEQRTQVGQDATIIKAISNAKLTLTSVNVDSRITPSHGQDVYGVWAEGNAMVTINSTPASPVTSTENYGTYYAQNYPVYAKDKAKVNVHSGFFNRKAEPGRGSCFYGDNAVIAPTSYVDWGEYKWMEDRMRFGAKVYDYSNEKNYRIGDVEDTTNYHATLDDAIKAAENGDNIYAFQDTYEIPATVSGKAINIYFDGHVLAPPSNETPSQLINVTNGGSVTIHDAKASNPHGAVIKVNEGGAAKIASSIVSDSINAMEVESTPAASGNLINTTISAVNTALVASGTGATGTIDGGDYDTASNTVYATNGAEVTLSLGRFHAEGNVHALKTDNGGQILIAPDRVAIPNDAADYLNKESLVLVGKPAARINDVVNGSLFLDIHEAIKNLKDGDTLYLLNDIHIPLGQTGLVFENKTCVFDLNGKTITSKAQSTIFVYASDMTIKNGSIKNDAQYKYNDENANVAILTSVSELTLDGLNIGTTDMTIPWFTHAVSATGSFTDVTILSGDYNSTYVSLMALDYANITIDKGRFSSQIGYDAIWVNTSYGGINVAKTSSISRGTAPDGPSNNSYYRTYYYCDVDFTNKIELSYDGTSTDHKSIQDALAALASSGTSATSASIKLKTNDWLSKPVTIGALSCALTIDLNGYSIKNSSNLDTLFDISDEAGEISFIGGHMENLTVSSTAITTKRDLTFKNMRVYGSNNGVIGVGASVSLDAGSSWFVASGGTGKSALKNIDTIAPATDQTISPNPWQGSSMVTVSGAEAMIERNNVNKTYQTLQAALDDVQNGETITLLTDIILNDSVTASSKSFMLDLAKHTIQNIDGKEILRLLEFSNCNLSIKNGNITSTCGTTNSVATALHVGAGSELTLENVNIKAARAGIAVYASSSNVNMMSGIYTGGVTPMYLSDSTLVPTTGTLVKSETSDSLYRTIYLVDNSKVDLRQNIFVNTGKYADTTEKVAFSIRGEARIGEDPFTATYYDTLKAALDAAQDGDTVYLVKSVNYLQKDLVTMKDKENITLDLCGNVISGMTESVIIQPAKNSIHQLAMNTGKYPTLKIQNSTDITIRNGTINGQLSANDEALLITSGSSVTLQNITITCDGNKDSAISVVEKSSIVVNSGKISSNSGYALAVEDESSCTLVGGTFTNKRNMSGEGYAKEAFYGQITIHEDSTTDPANDWMSASKVEVIPKTPIVDPKEPTLTPAARIGSVNYDYLQDAFDNAKDGDTIVLLRNIGLMEPIISSLKGHITLDLNKRTISSMTELAHLINSGGSRLTITGDGKLQNNSTLGGGTVYVASGELDISSGQYIGKTYSIYASEGSFVNLCSGTFTAQNNGKTAFTAYTSKTVSGAALINQLYLIETGSIADPDPWQEARSVVITETIKDASYNGTEMSLKEALTYAQTSGGAIKLLTSISPSSTIHLYGNTSLDLNGYTIGSNIDNVLSLSGDNNTVTNGYLNASLGNGIQSSSGSATISAIEITAGETALIANGDASLIIASGKYTGKNPAVLCDESGSILLQTGTFNAQENGGVAVSGAGITLSAISVATPENWETAQAFALTQSDLPSLGSLTNTYLLTLSADNGIAASTKFQYNAGDTVTIYASPNANYKFENWTVSSGGITISALQSRQTFVMPANDVELTATFSYDPNAGNNGRGDGSGDASGTQDGTTGSAIDGGAPQPEKYAEAPFINGYPDGSFRPDNPITRAEVAKIFYDYFAENDTSPSTTNLSAFSDIADDHWGAAAMSWALSKVLFEGYPDGTIKPDNQISRAEASALMSRVRTTFSLTHGNKVDSPKFSDIDEHWAYSQIMELAELGIVNGYSDGTFAPSNSITRAEFVTMAGRLLGRSEKFTPWRTPSDIEGHWAYPQIMNAYCGLAEK